MNARVAAAYCGERSVEAFLRSVGELYPRPIKVPGKGDRWLRDTLDATIDELVGVRSPLRDAAEVL